MIPTATTEPQDALTSTMFVTKRDGSQVPFNLSEIRDSVKLALSAHPQCSQVEFESSITKRLYDGIPTADIQEILVQAASELASPENTAWLNVAGHLNMQSRIHRCQKLGVDYGVDSVADYITDYIGNGLYNERLLEYSYKNFLTAAKWINPALDYDYNLIGTQLLNKRYLYDDELLQVSFLVDALILASVEKGSRARMKFARRIYDALSQRKISLATPILSNLRKQNSSIGSCYIISAEDDIESIFAQVANVARISKSGGGVGFCVSKIRATGSEVMGRPNASNGVIPWIKIINDTAIAVDQGGNRAGAVTVALDIWHLDIPEFLEMQTENGDQRRKAYDVFPQVVTNDVFDECVKTETDWLMFCPYEVEKHYGIKIAELWGNEFAEAYAEIKHDYYQGNYKGSVKCINARQLYKQILKTCVETGLPYISRKDAINRANPNKNDGYIPCVNLCVESFSNVSADYAHSCNLVSQNLANIDTDNPEEFKEICDISVRLLDNAIDITTPPFKESGAHNNRYRTIGVGTMGLADWMAKNELLYSDVLNAESAARQKLSKLYEDFAYYCTNASMELAKEREPFTAFKDSEWDLGCLLGSKSLLEIQSIAIDKDRWEDLTHQVGQHGIRNSHITAIAPNTSSSLVQGCTASILPTYEKFYEDKWSGGTFISAPPFLQDKWHWYQENVHLDQNVIIEVTAIIQQWIDTGVSMELVFNPAPDAYYSDELGSYGANPKHIFDVHQNAVAQNIKAIYYQRIVNNEEKVVECSVCAN